MAKYELVLEDTFSPMYGDVLVIPPWTAFWRGYDPNFPIISSRPAYYSTREIASGYANPAKGLELGAFCASQPLHVLDVRFLHIILRQLFEESRAKYTAEDKNTLLCVQTSFGLCSLGHQIELMMDIYGTEKNPSLASMIAAYNSKKLLEQPGVRVAETNIDGFTMYFLQGLFENLTKCRIDGFISPRLYSPFHIEKPSMSMSPELILFNPSKVNVRKINPPLNLPKITVSSLLYTNHHSILTLDYGHFGTSLLMQHGEKSSNDEPAIEAFNRKLDRKDKDAMKQSKKGRAAGLRWATMLPSLTWIEPPSPKIPHIKLTLDELN